MYSSNYIRQMTNTACFTSRKVTNHEKDEKTYSKNGTYTKKTARYKVQQMTAVFLCVNVRLAVIQ